MDTRQWGWVVSLGLGMAIVPILPIQAQIIPDNSLGNERSVTTPTETGVQIDGGALRGDNLFHSFQEFSIPTNSEAFFNNPDIANIFSRVTGGSISDIDGLLRANGTANLFLLNPNGIIFGPNARLDIGGSFVASTANSLVFENGLAFNAEESGEAPLLSVNVPLGVQFNDNPGSIEATGATLNVSEGESMALVGGEISLEDVEINAPAGRIDLVGVGEPGQVSFEVGDVNSGFPSFGVPAELSRASVSLDEANLNVAGVVGGEIGIQALDIEIRDSGLGGGISRGLGFEGGESGNIELDAMGDITISDGGIVNSVREGSIGNAGDINLSADNVELNNGAQLSLSTLGQGDAGSVTLRASNSIVISGSNSDDFPSAIFNQITETGQGNAGSISLIGEVIEISEGALLSSSTFGVGNAGNLSIEASDTARFLNANVFSNVAETGQGNAGNIVVIGDRVEVRDGASLVSNSRDQGDAGNVSIVGETVQLTGGASLSSSTLGEGNAGTITVEVTGHVLFSDSSASSSSFGEVDSGNAGNVSITGETLEFQDGSRLSSTTGGDGDAGRVIVEASGHVLFSDSSASSGSFGENYSGNAGEIRVIGETVELRDGARLFSSTFGQGDGGIITVEAGDTIVVSNASISSGVAESGTGNAGGVSLRANTVELLNEARLSSSTSGEGDAGRVVVEASGHVLFSDSSASSSSFGEGDSGNAGNVRITGETIELRDGTSLSSSTSGDGDAGRVIVEASDHVLFSDSSASSGSFGENYSGNAGNIRVTGETVELRDGASLFSSTLGQGDGGTITVESGDTIVVSNASVSSDVGESGIGNAGGISIRANTVEVLNEASLSSGSLGDGDAGRVTVEASGHILFSDSSASSSSFGEGDSGNAGNISITGETVELRDGASLLSGTRGDGDAGRVIVEASGHVLFSDSSASSISFGEDYSGNAGNIRVIGESVELRDGTSLSSSTLGQGNAGSVTIEASDTAQLSNANVFSTVEERAKGNGGDIQIITNTLFLEDGAQLNVNTLGEGNAGTIIVQAHDRVILSGVNSDGLGSRISSVVAESGRGNAGGVRISADSLEMRDGAQLNASTLGQGNAGTVTIEASGAVLFSNSFAASIVGENTRGNSGGVNIIASHLEVRDGAALISSTLGQGDAGTIRIEVGNVVFSNGFVFSTVQENGQGNAGDVSIISNTLEMRDRSQLNSSTLGEGNAGTVRVEARDTISFSGLSSREMPLGIFSAVEETGRGNAGGVSIRANTVEMNDGAQLNSSTFGQGNAGTVTIEANDRVILSGLNNPEGLATGAFSAVGENARGNAGDVRISADSLEMRDGAQLNVSTAGQGNAGTVTVEASGEVLLSNSFAASLVEENARGNAGGVSILTGSLEVQNGAQINSITIGQGNAGTIRVEASDRVIFSGVNPEGVPSAGLTSVGETGQGDAGGISILANSLELRDGAILDSSTVGQGNAGTVSIEVSETFLLSNGFVGSGVGEEGRGNAGNITVLADRLEVHDGVLLSSSFNEGNAGTVTVEVRDSAIFSGLYTEFSDSEPEVWPSGLYSTIEEAGQGNAGGVNLIAGTVELRDGTRLSSSNNATSNANDFTAGDVFVQADHLHLSDRADISANTGGRGGNVRLDTGTTILRRGSTIQTNAEGDFSGGNIIIDTDALVALENSDITANAINAAGGQVIINTQGIFGTEFRDELTPQSDITASSNLGAEFSGSVELNTPDVDTETGLVDLSANPIDVAAILDTNPCTGGRESEFYVTGRGGLPPNPDGSLATEATWLDWRSLEETSSETALSHGEETAPLVEAQGWHVNGDGAVVLSAETADGSPTPPQATSAHCSPTHPSR